MGLLKNKYITALLISATIFILLWLIPISYNIDKTVVALMVSGANNTETFVEVQINGVYTRRFLRDDSFRGNFAIGDFALTNRQNYVIDINLGQSHSWLEYRRVGGFAFSWYHFGLIYANNNFREFLIVPLQEYIDNPMHIGTGHVEMSGETLTVIAYPAKTRYQALRLANRKLQGLLSPYFMEG